MARPKKNKDGEITFAELMAEGRDIPPPPLPFDDDNLDIYHYGDPNSQGGVDGCMDDEVHATLKDCSC